MKSPPSRWWHLFAVLVFLSGAVGAPVVMFITLFGLFSEGEEFVVPGRHSLQLEREGKYIVWSVTSTFRDGRQHHYSDTLPSGTRIRIIEEESGAEIPTARTMSATETSGNTARRSVCSFIIAAPGIYSVVVDELDEQRLLMVRRSAVTLFLWVFLFGGIFSVFCWLVAPAISIIVEVRRYHFRRSLSDS